MKVDWNRKNELDELITASASLALMPESLSGGLSEKNLVSFVNPYSYSRVLESDIEISKFILAVDGQLLRVMHRLVFGIDPGRKSFDFTSIASLVFSTCERRGWKLGFVGGKPGEPEAAISNIAQKHPLLEINYCRHGFFDSDLERERCFAEIRDAAVDIFICGMGTPMQEEFLIKGSEANCFRWGMSCGGFISQTAEALYYYPKFVMRYGFRALYRFYRHDYLRRRYLYDYPRFLVIYILGLLNRPG